MKSFLALLLMAVPVLADEKHDSFPPCIPVDIQKMSFHAKTEEALVFVQVLMPINIFAAEAWRCRDKGLVRSRKDRKCYRPDRLPQ